MMRIVFVCTGNTCRSPMAAALAGDMYPELVVFSAGLAPMPGAPASAHAYAVMREAGLDLACHRAQAVAQALLAEADLVLAMTETHKRLLSRAFPAMTPKIFTLGEYAGEPGDVDDPFGGDLTVYRACAEAIKVLLEKAGSRLRGETGADGGILPQEV